MTQEEFDVLVENWLAERMLEKESKCSRKEGWFQKAYSSKVMDGTKPQSFVTREELATILGRLGLLK